MDYFYNHTPMKMLKILKLIRCKDLSNQKWESYISAKDEVSNWGANFFK